MATIKYVDLARLTQYNELIKNYINTADTKAFKTAKFDETSRTLKLFKAESPADDAVADFTVEIPETDISGLLEKLTKLVNSEFTRIDHKDVITILKEAKVDWEFKPEYGEDIAKEHEKYITEYFNGPVFIKNWPKDIKAFYMKQNEDGETVAAVDLEVPGAGELMGGSQREEDYTKLVNRMKELGMETEGLDWYLNLRKFGGCVHSGFGMGFERLLIYLTGVDNIRDVIPYPRTPGNCEY